MCLSTNVCRLTAKVVPSDLEKECERKKDNSK